MKVLRNGFSMMGRIAWYGVDSVLPALGIPRPFNYLAGIFWLYWVGTLLYMIARK